METSTPSNPDDVFFDADDDFPFYDCHVSFSDEPDPSSTSSSSSSISHVDPNPPTDIISPSTSLRRRSSALASISGKESNDSSISSEINSARDARRSFRERKYKFYMNLKENEHKSESPQGGGVSSVLVPSGNNNEGSTVTSAADDRGGGDNSVDSAAELGDSSFNLLVFIAGLVIKAIGLQINLFISFVTFPIWVFYNSYMFAVDPFQTMRRGREYLIAKVLGLWDSFCGFCSPWVNEWLKEHKSIWKLALRCGWGLLWSFYVCFILCGLLVFSLVVSGITMRYLVEEPIQMKEILNFDYTKHSPVAYVPLISRAGAGCGMDGKEQNEVGRSLAFRVIPPSHKLQVAVSLTLPESQYNRNLGIFQVRVDLLSANGKTLASSSNPCILQFKSEPIRLLLTFLKVAPLVAGYVSESQTLKVKIRGFTEGDVPTACLRVTMEQRAEYQPGAGIPEIYEAFLVLESELPLFKRILWYWKKTIFVWISMTSFMMELLFALVCCRPIIIPRARTRTRDGAYNSRATQNGPSANS
ncbi:hypothetical protein FEM48_Zijuj01G0050600 [Ziziphus jujuba var. spinosa]|uniref:Seipin-2-like n=1 Tax=Ziziphus jujuba var. spinosa TaxID=714518 RepID=A0A978VZA0_ZIZJJ|nr:hypothetical protein FEM48_Zijuj01G0050600 [Ziziphus jujuba var. spinosa]